MTKNGYVLRSRDVAHLLDYSPDEAIELAQSRKIKAIKEGRFWKYRVADVIRYKKILERQARTLRASFHKPSDRGLPISTVF